MISAAATSPSARPTPAPTVPTIRNLLARGQGSKAEAWATGLKYDANNIYLATMYSETRKMTPISGGFANKAQNFEAVGAVSVRLRSASVLGYVLSKGKGYRRGGEVRIWLTTSTWA
ncbi:outer membrane pore protein E [Klebsiella pneumoniae]|uniref:Outer membrane pore protein E n=1 Tax=Klebsiella pneumoniae TaxID=573 RepID=A0A4P0XTV5_KLEPN|nr:outer membrane pore protein E [Klebsiella pneumoniae]